MINSKRGHKRLFKQGGTTMGFNIDADSRNADWSKRTWDLLDIDSKEKLLRYLEMTGMTVEQFKKLPVYKFNRDKLDFLKDL